MEKMSLPVDDDIKLIISMYEDADSYFVEKLRKEIAGLPENFSKDNKNYKRIAKNVSEKPVSHFAKKVFISFWCFVKESQNLFLWQFLIIANLI